MLLPPYELSERIRVLRLYAGMNQAEMAELLGMTQSWLSKLEAGIGELNAAHLQLLRKRFKISADDILDGSISFGAIAKAEKASLRVPKKYLRNANSRVRMLYGFVTLLEQELGEEAVREFFRSISVPTEILADPNYKVNLLLMFDVMAFGIERNVLTKEHSWEKVAQESITPLALGPAHSRLTQTKTPQERFERFCEIGRHYSSDFSYNIIHQTENSLQISALHAPTLGQTGGRQGKLNSALLVPTMRAYHKAMLEAIARMSPPPGLLSLESAGDEASNQHDASRFVFHAQWG